MRRLSARDRPSGHVRDGAARLRARPVAPMLDLALEAYEDGVPIRPQVAGRPLGLLLGLQTFHPLRRPPELPGDRRAPARREGRRACATPRCGGRSSPRRRSPTRDRRSSAWASTASSGSASRPTTSRPPRRASRRGPSPRVATPIEVLYDLLLEQDGRELLLRPLLGLLRLQPGPDPRDDPAPDERAGPGRRRRARRRDLRRVDPDVHAHPLGP